MGGRSLVIITACLFLVNVAASRHSSRGEECLKATGCGCNKQTEDCGCCAHIKFDVLHVHVDDDACVNVTYLPSEIGLDFTVTWNNDAIFNKTISATNPPPICFGVPKVKLLKVCVRFSNISYNKDHFGGCITLELEALGFKKDFPLGCIYSNERKVVQFWRKVVQKIDIFDSKERVPHVVNEGVKEVKRIREVLKAWLGKDDSEV